jgi:hypothetical protein
LPHQLLQRGVLCWRGASSILKYPGREPNWAHA